MYVHLISEQVAHSLATRGSANAARRTTSSTRRDLTGAPCVSPPLGVGSPSRQTHRRCSLRRAVGVYRRGKRLSGGLGGASSKTWPSRTSSSPAGPPNAEALPPPRVAARADWAATERSPHQREVHAARAEARKRAGADRDFSLANRATSLREAPFHLPPTSPARTTRRP